MKNEILTLLMLLVLVNTSFAMSYDYYCSETDGGYDIYTAGENEVTDADGLTLNKEEDVCLNSATLKEYACNESTGKSDPFTVTCPEGYVCSETKCVPNEVEPEPVYECKETDEGYDLYEKGTSTRYRDSDPISQGTDYCEEDGRVHEYWCGDGGGMVTGFAYDCPFGYACSDGACVSEPEEPEMSCTDSDGVDKYTRGTALQYEDSTLIFSSSDACYGSSTVTEKYCSDGVVLRKNLTCPSGYTCFAGACTPEDERDSMTCTETDSGKDYYKKGTSYGFHYVSGEKRAFEDSCTKVRAGVETHASKYIKEFFCRDGVVYMYYDECPSGYTCLNGECIDESEEETHEYACKESDDGYDLYEKGTSALYRDSHKVSTGTDYCVDRDTVHEYWCKSDSELVTGKSYSCPTDYVCSAGACVKDVDHWTCEESDDGDNVYIYGKIKFYDSSGNYRGYEEDYCHEGDSRLITEVVCNKYTGESKFVTKYCPSGYTCSEGACVAETDETQKLHVEVFDRDGNKIKSSEIRVYLHYLDGYGGLGVPVSHTDENGDATMWIEPGHPFNLDAINLDTKEKYGGKDGGTTEKYIVRKSGSRYKLCDYYAASFVSCSSLGVALYAEPKEEVPELPELPELPDYKEYTLELKKGWNLVSSPVKLEDELPGKAQVVATSCESPKIFVYDPSENKYVTEGYGLEINESIPVPDAFWVKATSPCKVTFRGEYESSYENTWKPREGRGWIAIGGPYNKVKFEEIAGDCEVLSGPWSFDTAVWRWRKSTALEPGKGYFVKLGGSCTLGADIPPFPSD